jgi:hypothetical protein
MSKSIRWNWLLLVALVALVCALGIQAQNPGGEETGAAPPAAEPTPSLGPPATPATASVLRLIRFSGSLSDQLGQPRSGVVGVTFALYAEQEGGAPLWLETQNVTLDAQGHYTVLLGATSSEGLPLEIFSSGEARWLGIQVQGEAEQPRVLLVAVPYALKAAEAETLSGKKAADFILNEQLSEQVQKEIETQVEEKGLTRTDEDSTTPEAVTETGRSTFTDTNSSEVVFVEQSGAGFGLRATAPSNSGLRGETTDTTGTPAGVEGVAASNRGRGVYGHTTNGTGKNIGVLGESSSVEGTGVFGSALAATGNTTGVRGDAESTTGVGVFGFARALTGTPVGVRGQTFSRDGIGVEGLASPAGGFAVGVKGESISNRGRGVHGLASHSTGIVFGVLGETPSTKGRGVYGVATAATGPTVGVRGDTFSLDGTGVTGFARHATGGIAVYGLAIGASAVAGQFENAGGGKILSGVTSGKSEVFSVDDSGRVTSAGVTSVLATGGHCHAIFGRLGAAPGGFLCSTIVGITDGTQTDVAILAQSNDTTGAGVGIRAEANSANGVAGVFHNTNGGGKILSGRSGADLGTEVFSVDGSGNIETAAAVKFGDGTQQASGFLYAVVASDGTLARNSAGVVSAALLSVGTGTYEVIFSRNVTTCAYVATQGLTGSTGVPDPGMIGVVGRGGNANGVFVKTYDETGTAADRAFHLSVFCPGPVVL